MRPACPRMPHPAHRIRAKAQGINMRCGGIRDSLLKGATACLFKACGDSGCGTLPTDEQFLYGYPHGV